MGFFSNLWSGIKKVGSSIASGAKKVGSWVQEGAKKVGEVGGKVVDVAQKIQPFVSNIPVVGQVVGAVAKAGKIVDIAKDIGSGNWKKGLGDTLDFASGLGGVAGQAGKIIKSGWELGQRAGAMKNPNIGDVVNVGREAYGLGRQLGGLYRP